MANILSPRWWKNLFKKPPKLAHIPSKTIESPTKLPVMPKISSQLLFAEEENMLTQPATIRAKGRFRYNALHDACYYMLNDTHTRELKSALVKVHMGPLSLFTHLQGEAMAAGGYIRRLFTGFDFKAAGKPVDIDVFLDTKCPQASAVATDVCNRYPQYSIKEFHSDDRVEIHSSDTVIDIISFHRKDDILEVIQEFDFTNCMCGVTTKGRIAFNSWFISDNKQKQLNMGSDKVYKNPVTGLRRLLKFAGEGYKINDELLASVCIAQGISMSLIQKHEYIKEQYG